MTSNFIHSSLLGRFHLRMVGLCVALAFSPLGQAADIEFNTDILDVNDRANIDLSQFSKSGYLMPGEYRFTVHVNKLSLPEQSIFYYVSPTDKEGSEVCLTPDLVEQFGLKEDVLNTLTWWNDGACLSLDSLPGTEAKADLAGGVLYINMPQALFKQSPWVLFSGDRSL